MTKNQTVNFTVFTFAALVTVLLSGLHTAEALDNNLNITGNLVAEPCTIDTDKPLEVDFKTVILKSLYSQGRSPSVPFHVELKECDTAMGQSASLTFKGAESLALPGLITAEGSGGQGIAIGMEQPDGTALPFNQATPAYALQDGTTTIALAAYIQAEPNAITDQTLTPGDFTATATFEVAYP